MDPAVVGGLLQLGGVLAFAVIVWLELRAMRVELREDRREASKAAADDRRENTRIMTELRDDVIRLAERTGPVQRRRTDPG
jgi:UDP-2,3-diacylglucosamine pyrophosphatase LpxH